jgi:hypothetical protein
MRAARASSILILLLACIPAAFAVDCYEEIDPYYWQFDVPSMIQVRTPADVARVRGEVIDYIWGPAGWPGEKLPASVTTIWDADSLGYDCDAVVDPATIGGLKLWLDAGDPASLLLVDGRVAAWRDRSGHGHDATQANPARRPLYATMGINGRPAITFDGIDDLLEASDHPDLDLAQATIFLVLESTYSIYIRYEVPLAKRPVNGAYLFVIDHDTHLPIFRVSTGGLTRDACDLYNPTTRHGEIWTGRQDGQLVTLLRNGAQVGVGAAPGPIDATTGPLRLGDGEGNAYMGDIAEVLIYNQALPDSAMLGISAYLGCKYGIRRDLPLWIRTFGTENLRHVDRLDIPMDYGLHSYAYLLKPMTSINRLLVFHQGHDDYIPGYGGQQTIRWFLQHGHTILTFWMPLNGENTRVAHDVPGHGTVTLTSHDQMAQVLENSQGSFLRFFLEPVVVGLNYAQAAYDFDDINMTGVSGGGWTTHLMSAIDPRIRLSFPVAGSLPLYLRYGPCANGSLGDAEQIWPALYQDRASWPDLYVLGGQGSGREQIQVLNHYDSCCFWGINYQTYEPYVHDTVAGFGNGAYSVYLDSSHHEHKISDAVIQGVMEPLLDGELPAAAPVETARPISTLRVAPNPGDGRVTIECAIGAADARAAVTLEIFDAAGRRVRRMSLGAPGLGAHSLGWDGRDDAGRALPAGAYGYRMRIGDRAESGRAIVVR